MPKYSVDRKQLYSFHVYNEVFRFNFYLVWCECKNRLHDYLVANDDSGFVDQLSVTSIGSMYPIKVDGHPVPVVVLPFKWQKTPSQIATVTHEVIHAVCNFFRNRVIPLPKDLPPEEFDEENFCYHVDHLVCKFIEALDNQDKHKYKFSDEKNINKKKN